MGFRFRKSINLGGGIRLNAGKKGIGVSAGVKGLRVSHGADGKTRVTASIPGTGISYQETLSSQKKSRNSNKVDKSMFRFDGHNALYEFRATVNRIEIEGERDTETVLLYQPALVSFYPAELHIKTFNKDLGGDEIYCSVDELSVKKEVNQGKFLFWAYSDVFIYLSVENSLDKVYTLKLASEAEADKFIEWFDAYKLHITR